MESEEANPGLLTGWFVVEVGVRQAWPFLILADPRSGREVRIYVDAAVSVTSYPVPLRQDDPKVLLALDRINNATVSSASVKDRALILRFGADQVCVSGEANELTTGSPWWFEMQAPGERGSSA